MVNLPVKLNENARIDLKFNNAWAIAISIITTSFIVGMFYSGLKSNQEITNNKLDVLIANQNELKQDFKSWKIQAETRLGKVEIGYNRNRDAIAYIMRFLKL